MIGAHCVFETEVKSSTLKTLNKIFLSDRKLHIFLPVIPFAMLYLPSSFIFHFFFVGCYCCCVKYIFLNHAFIQFLSVQLVKFIWKKVIYYNMSFFSVEIYSLQNLSVYTMFMFSFCNANFLHFQFIFCHTFLPFYIRFYIWIWNFSWTLFSHWEKSRSINSKKKEIHVYWMRFCG